MSDAGEQSTETSTEENGKPGAEALDATNKTLADVTAKLEAAETLVAKLRKHEKDSLERENAEKAKRLGVEGELDAFKTEVASTLKDMAVSNALESELIKSNVHNVDTAKRLINKAGIEVKDGKANLAQVLETINNLKETDSYLFKADVVTDTKQPAPKPGRPGEVRQTNSGLEAELKNAKSTKEVQAILNKYQ